MTGIRSMRRLSLHLLVLVALLPVGTAQSQAPPAGPGVAAILVLDELDPLRPIFVQFLSGLRAVVDTGLAQRPAYFVEGLDLQRVGAPWLGDRSIAWVTEKYANQDIDVLVAIGDSAIVIAQRLRAAWGRDIPLISLYTGTNRRGADSLPTVPNGVSFLVADVEREAVRNMRALLPRLREVLVIAQSEGEASEVGDRMAAAAEGQLRVEVIGPPSLVRLRERFRTLGPDAAVFLHSVGRDAEGQPWVGREFMKVLSAMSPRPVFGYLSTYVGAGAVGGPMLDGTTIGSEVGALTLHLLQGAPAAATAPRLILPTTVVYDWAQLQRFDIPEERLLPGATIVNRPLPVWQVFPRTTAMVGGVLVLLLGGVVVLVWNRRQLRRAHAARAALSQRMLQAQDEERRRIARDLHDDLCQEMTVLALQADRAMPPGTAASAGLAPLLGDQIRQLIDRTRELAMGLHTLQHDSMSLPDLCRAHAANLQERTGLDIRVSAAGWPASVAPEVAQALFRSLQEAIQNVLRHAEATQVNVTLEGEDGRVRMAVRDDGIGFDATAQTGNGLGLAAMRERLEGVGGTCTVASTPLGGTTVTLQAPADLAAVPTA